MQCAVQLEVCCEVEFSVSNVECGVCSVECCVWTVETVVKLYSEHLSV